MSRERGTHAAKAPCPLLFDGAIAHADGAQIFEATLHIGPDDAQIAEVVNYVRSHFGNHYSDAISAAEFKAMHPH